MVDGFGYELFMFQSHFKRCLQVFEYTVRFASASSSTEDRCLEDNLETSLHEKLLLRLEL